MQHNDRHYEPEDLPGEVWKRARGKGLGNLRVSNLGRFKLVKRTKTVIRLGVPVTRHYREQLLRPICPFQRIDPNSYLQIIVNGNRSFSVHRLVVQAFKGLIPPGHEVNHIDGNKQNNCLTNLEVLTISAHKAMQTGITRGSSRVFTIHERLDMYHKRRAGSSLINLAVEYNSLPITVKRTIEGTTLLRYVDFLECVQKGLPELTRLLTQGYMIRGIARLYSVPITKVERLLKALNLTTTPCSGDILEMRKKGYTLEQTAEAHGVSREAIRQRLLKAGN